MNAATSSDPFATHHRFKILSGLGEHMNMMKIKTPCNAINTSKNANGDMAAASFGEIDVLMWDVSISIIIQIDINAKRNATLWALIQKDKKNHKLYSYFNNSKFKTYVCFSLKNSSYSQTASGPWFSFGGFGRLVPKKYSVINKKQQQQNKRIAAGKM